jgi:hypothetical protein
MEEPVHHQATAAVVVVVAAVVRLAAMAEPEAPEVNGILLMALAAAAEVLAIK